MPVADSVCAWPITIWHGLLTVATFDSVAALVSAQELGETWLAPVDQIRLSLVTL
jgi:hypothetical protein